MRIPPFLVLVLAIPIGAALAYGLHWSANHGPLGLLLFMAACVILLGLSLCID